MYHAVCHTSIYHFELFILPRLRGTYEAFSLNLPARTFSQSFNDTPCLRTKNEGYVAVPVFNDEFNTSSEPTMGRARKEGSNMRQRQPSYLETCLHLTTTKSAKVLLAFPGTTVVDSTLILLIMRLSILAAGRSLSLRSAWSSTSQALTWISIVEY